MMIDTSEKDFEASIEAALLGAPGQRGLRESPDRGDALDLVGWGAPGDYARGLCLDPELALGFIYATQPAEWDRLRVQYGEEARAHFLKRLAAEVTRRGTLDVLRNGVKDSGCKFALAAFKPATGLNPDEQLRYQANVFSVIRQLPYSQKTGHTLDMVIFLNGLPIFSAELKNPFKGQVVLDAMRQYREDRDPREPFFALGRCLAHFAVDTDLVYMTTHVNGARTVFLPFNQGRDGGAGNPPAWQGFATAYLWYQTWSRDSVLDLVQNFVQLVDEEDEQGRKTGVRRLLFPRYHQLVTVRRLVAGARQRGPGQSYLIQHSAGSGKSNTIAWLAHQLGGLHDGQDRRIFDSIIVITDRRILDRQLQATVRQFQKTLGIVENIDQTSRQLKQALEDGKTIIVTTLQKFPVIVDQMGELPGKRFAVIIDEAHSSQSGESVKSLKSVLAAGSLAEAAAAEDATAAQEPDLEDRIVAEMQRRGRLPNVSTFAFTATPKAKTLELFGTRASDGSFQPFSLYTMRQAIDEGFILDVLENYTTYQTYWSLLKKIEDDPRYDRHKAAYLLAQFVDFSEHTIRQKVAVMVEHFNDHVLARIGGHAKAMVVTRSRLHAVRYKQAMDAYLAEKGAPYRALVAFSGIVRDGGIDYTESAMNGFPESQTAEAFKQDGYRILIVAEKFQTGFDQPLLHTMYVDKLLGGVHAVQTLSRLNRVYPGKSETMVLDFANRAEDIQQAFEPYYDRTILSQGTDPNLLYDLQNTLAGYGLYAVDDVERFAKLYFSPKMTQDRLHGALAPVVDAFKAAPEATQVEFRGHLTDYVRLYAFLSQILTFVDAELEKLYVFGRLLLRKLPIRRERLPVEIQQAIDLDSFRIQETGKGKIALRRGAPPLEPIGAKQIYGPAAPELEPLSQIIEELNRRFGTAFTEADRVVIQYLEASLHAEPALEASLRINTPENARLTFDTVATDRFQDLVETNFQFYKRVTDDAEFAAYFLDWLFKRYMAQTGEPGAKSA